MSTYIFKLKNSSLSIELSDMENKSQAEEKMAKVLPEGFSLDDFAVTKKEPCPYCHVGSNLKGRYNRPGSPWDDGELNLEEVVSPQISVGNDTWGDIGFDPERAVLTSWGEGTDPLVVKINFCPFCGQSLRGDD